MFTCRINSFAEIHINQGGNIQAAINSSNDGEVIVVHQGIYYENIDFLGKAITVRSLDPEDPSIVATTIIDGQDAGTVIFFGNEEGANSVLSGITLRNGNRPNGNGIRLAYSSPRITNCIITENSAEYGGGIHCDFSSPEISNCVISNNSAQWGGGGICVFYSDPKVTNCIITQNSAEFGGGVSFFESNLEITNCTFYENYAAWDGGGINEEPTAGPPMGFSIVTNCIFWSLTHLHVMM